MAHFEKQHPAECSEEQLASFKQFVLAGGEVRSQGLDLRIRNAEWLVFAFDQSGTLVAVGALKRPAESYKSDVFRKANLQGYSKNYQYEIGWIFVRPRNRGQGYSKGIVKEILDLVGTDSLYATTRIDNIFMKRVLLRYGFSQAGQQFPSQRGDHNLILLTRPPVDQ